MQTRLPLAKVQPLPQRPCPTNTEALLAFHRSVFGGTRMGPPPPDDDPNDDPKDPPGKTFTQEQVDAINARTRDQAERKAQRDLLVKLGLPEDTKPEDAKSKLDAARATELAALSDADRVKREAADAKAEAEREKATATARQRELDQERHDLRVTGLLERAGVGADAGDDDEKRDKAMNRAMRLLDVEVGADSDVIRKAIKELQTDVPGLFSEAPAGGLPDGRPGSGPGGQRSKGKSGVAAGREEAIRRGWIKDTAKTA